MRIAIAGLFGGLVILVWSTLVHTVLPIGMMGLHLGAPHEAVLGALKQDAMAGPGVYIYPSLTADKMLDEQASKDFAPIETANSYAFVVFQPTGKSSTEMGGNIAKQFGSNVLAALLAAFVLSAGTLGFGKRVLISGMLGLFAWMAVSVPWWNWYRFPTPFIVGSLIEQVVGWLLAGTMMAWWLGRQKA